MILSLTVPLRSGKGILISLFRVSNIDHWYHKYRLLSQSYITPPKFGKSHFPGSSQTGQGLESGIQASLTKNQESVPGIQIVESGIEDCLRFSLHGANPGRLQIYVYAQLRFLSA